MNKLKTFRQMHKISQKELANVLCTTQQQISLYKTGRRKLDEDQIAEICKVYKINPEEILEEYTKLPAPERTMVELMVEEHNKRYK